MHALYETQELRFVDGRGVHQPEPRLLARLPGTRSSEFPVSVASAGEPSAITGFDPGSTPDRLAQAATALFARNGYQGTSIDDIVDAAKLTKPTFYYHFSSKQQLLAILLTNSLMSIELALAAAGSPEEPPEIRLAKLMRAYALEVCNRPRLWAIYFAEKKELSDVTIVSNTKREREMVQVFETVIREGITTGVFRKVDPTVSALAVMGMAGWLHLWFDAEGPLGAEDMADAFSQMAVASLGPDRPSNP